AARNTRLRVLAVVIGHAKGPLYHGAVQPLAGESDTDIDDRLQGDAVGGGGGDQMIAPFVDPGGNGGGGGTAGGGRLDFQHRQQSQAVFLNVRRSVVPKIIGLRVRSAGAAILVVMRV